MTPTQKIKWAILALEARWNKKQLPAITTENVDELYEALVAEDGHWDPMEEIRCTGIASKLTRQVDYQAQRHYEYKEVAAEMPDGTWVGWTYWHGGGKFGEPRAIDWMNDAYFVEHREEPIVIINHVFTLTDTATPA